MDSKLAELDARLRRLEDIEEIRRLRMQYHFLMNEGRAGEMAGLYTEDATIEFEGVVKAQGRTEVGRAIPALSRRMSFVKQFPANHLVDVHGDEAIGIAYLDARYAMDGESIMACARFAEKYRRTADGWKISEMVCRTYFNVPVQQGWAANRQNLVLLTEEEVASGERLADPADDR